MVLISVLAVFAAVQVIISLAFVTATRASENTLIMSDAAKQENAAVQAMSVSCEWLYNSIKEGVIPMPQSEDTYTLPSESPIYEVPEELLKNTGNNSDIEINAKIIDGYHRLSTDAMSELGIAFRKPRNFVVSADNTEVHYIARHYYVVVWARKKSLGSELRLSRELLILKDDIGNCEHEILFSKKEVTWKAK